MRRIGHGRTGRCATCWAASRRPGGVEHDPDAAGYVHLPLEWAPSPDSPCRKLFSGAVIEKHLKALAAKQQADGGWPISWDPISPAVELEWRGIATLNALRILKSYEVPV